MDNVYNNVFSYVVYAYCSNIRLVFGDVGRRGRIGIRRGFRDLRTRGVMSGMSGILLSAGYDHDRQNDRDDRDRDKRGQYENLPVTVFFPS